MKAAVAPPLVVFLSALLALCLLAGGAILAVNPPDPAPLSASAHEFSAHRAHATLSRLLANVGPHWVGSDANRVVRQRIEVELAALGLVTWVVSGVSCSRLGMCSEVHNVLAELPGRLPGRAVGIAAHYDSVPVGPGAADDGAGVASVLEVARALQASGGPERPVLLLFTDGEEMGLLGARQLSKDRALLDRLAVLVNLEARGVEGPSLMFETSTPNLELVSAFARSVERPVASSAFYAVYKALPNDTDLSVLREAGVAGLNFAFIRGARHYHTPRDDLAHLSLASLQHEGEQALAFVRELDRSPLGASREDALFFDVLGRKLLVFPLALARWLSAAAVSVGLLVLGLQLRSGSLRLSHIGAGSAAWLGGAALALLAGLILDAGLRPSGALDEPWPANGGLIVMSAHAASLAALLAAAALVGAALEPRATLCASLAAWLLLLAAVTFWLPEACFAMLLPALATLPAALIQRPSQHLAIPLLAALPLLVSTTLWAPIDRLAYDALGVNAPVLSAALAWLVVTPLLAYAALLSRKQRGWAAALASAFSLLAFASALFSPATSLAAPGRVSLAHQSDLDRDTARWLVDARRLPAELASAASFAPHPLDEVPWFGAWLGARHSAPAPLVAGPAPTLELVRRTPLKAGGRTLELLLRPGNSAALALTLALPAHRVTRATVDGEPAPLLLVGARQLVTRVSPAARGVRVELDVAGADLIHGQLLEHTSGLPQVAAPLVRARNRSASPSQTGDVSIRSRQVRF